MPFGKHVGVEIADLPDGYLAWLYETADLHGALEVCVEREYFDRFGDPDPGPSRGSRPELPSTDTGVLSKLTPAQHSVAIKIIEAGYRDLAKKNHPDAGGDHRAMVAINITIEVLRKALGSKNGAAL